MSEEQLAREHARACWLDPTGFAERGPRTPIYVQAALAELERVQSEGPGVLQALLEGGNQIARQLNADAFQGFREVVQNADDLGATIVRVGVRTEGVSRRLLIVHDGEPVDLMHVLPMMYPAISTKRNLAGAKGRFGVGLKTLSRLGEGLTVHSAPYHFTAHENFAKRAPPAEAIAGFYDPERDTLVTLDLDEAVGANFLTEAFEGWSAGELLFLDGVRAVTVSDLDAGELLFQFEVTGLSAKSKFVVKLQDTDAAVRETRFSIGGRKWRRYNVEIPVPAGMKRAHKATSSTTRLAIALPTDGQSAGRIHVALPTRIATGAAFSLDAQFNPATSREELSNDLWNKWLIEVGTAFGGALAIHLARQGSPLAWFLAPVGARTNSTSQWLNELFEAGWSKALAAIAGDPDLIGPGLPLLGVSYAEAEVEDLLDAEDHLAVTGLPMLPTSLRDALGRWRDVVEAIGLSTPITLNAVIKACAENFNGKQARWFAALALRCLDGGEEWSLYEAPWMPLAGGGRARPLERDEATELLVLEPSSHALVERHGLCRPVDPVLLEDAFEGVIDWLETHANLARRATAEDILGAFATKYAETPLEISRPELVELRDLFAEAKDHGIEDLGASVGQALLIEAFHHERDEKGKPRMVTVRARPGEVYLSRAIEDDQDGWSRAAGETPGLLWAASVYSDVFKVAARRGAPALRRMRGAKRFLMLLGARTSPRLQQGDTAIGPYLPPLQQPARRPLGRAEGVLSNDSVSPDLDRVLAEIIAAHGAPAARSRGKGRTRGASRADADRGVALFRCLTANWHQLEDRVSVAVKRNSGRGGVLTWVPATWLARLANTKWLVNEAGQLSRPEDLWISTKVMRAIDGDPARFAAGLDARDAQHPLASRLRMKVDPKASELITAIEARREHPEAGDAADLLRIYRALSAHCPQGSSSPPQDARVGDITVSALRAKFGISRSRAGLIIGQITSRGGEEWYPPTAVYSGKDIFHGRAPFVLAERDFAPLWNALNIKEPDIGACVRELERIAMEPPETVDESTLIDIYRHLDQLVAGGASAADRRRLVTIPLRVGHAWTTERPIFHSEYRGAEVSAIAVWTPPCAPSTVRQFMTTAGIEPLEVDDTPLSPSFGAEEAVQSRFEAALRILQSDLARDDEKSYRALEPWERCLSLGLDIHGADRLAVRARPPHGKPFAMTVRAHADIPGAMLHVDVAEALGRAEYGGMMLARFARERRREIALAWVSAWAASADAPAAPTISLARDDRRTGAEALEREFDKQKRMPAKRTMKSGTASAGATPPPRIEVRELKDFPLDVEFSVDLREASGEAKYGQQPRRAGSLREGPKPGADKDGSKGEQDRAPVTAHRQYDAASLQRLGWAYVEAAIDDGTIPLTNLQAQRGVGADGTLDWKTFIEMKSVGREAPGAVNLTASEFKKARQAKDDYLLVMVSGLEKGFQTRLQVYANPLASLPWTADGGVTLGGLGAGAALVFEAKRQE